MGTCLLGEAAISSFRGGMPVGFLSVDFSDHTERADFSAAVDFGAGVGRALIGRFLVWLLYGFRGTRCE